MKDLKVILLESGKDPRIEIIDGGDPVEELVSLLDGSVKFTELTPCLRLVTRRHGCEQRLPMRYRCDTTRLAFPIYGDCAVVRVNDCNQLCNVAEKLDMVSVCRRIRPLKEG